MMRMEIALLLVMVLVANVYFSADLIILNRVSDEISEQLGYENPWNFSTAFRRKVGMSPSQYRTAFRTMKG